MSSYIDGFIEIKGKHPLDRWRYVGDDIVVESQDSPFWCYLFGFNCGKYDDKPIDHEGIFGDNIFSGYDAVNGMSDYSFHLIGMFQDDQFHNSVGPYYIHVDDIDKIDYSQVSTEYEIGPDYERIFNEMKEYKKKGLESRLVCWFY